MPPLLLVIVEYVQNYSSSLLSFYYYFILDSVILEAQVDRRKYLHLSISISPLHVSRSSLSFLISLLRHFNFPPYTRAFSFPFSSLLTRHQVSFFCIPLRALRKKERSFVTQITFFALAVRLFRKQVAFQ